MIFDAAVMNLLEGHGLKRREWTEKYLWLLKGQDYIWEITKGGNPSINAKIYIPSVEDLNAIDWVLL